MLSHPFSIHPLAFNVSIEGFCFILALIHYIFFKLNLLPSYSNILISCLPELFLITLHTLFPPPLSCSISYLLSSCTPGIIPAVLTFPHPVHWDILLDTLIIIVQKCFIFFLHSIFSINPFHSTPLKNFLNSAKFVFA